MTLDARGIEMTLTGPAWVVRHGKVNDRDFVSVEMPARLAMSFIGTSLD
jgi:hypothetical protein